MSLLVVVIIVILVAALFIAAWRAIPNIPTPLDWIVPVLVLIVAAIIIILKAGLL